MRNLIEWKVGGQQGEGIDSTGEIFAKTLVRFGYYVSTYKHFSSRIKGGHTNYKIRATKEPSYYAGEKVDILLALDKESLPHNKEELKKGSVVILMGKALNIDRSNDYMILEVPLKDYANDIGNVLVKNMIGLGMSGSLLGLPLDLFDTFIAETFEKKGQSIIDLNKAAVRKGYELTQEHLSDFISPLEKGEPTEKLYISGNEATAFGSFMAGCRYLSAYPITPASEVMEWLSEELPSVGGTVIQVEDEIAGITFAIGASYSGVRAMTSTSGPGLSLKTEALGLAAMSETPIVIVNSQRGGPSTGLPTKHEQSDLNHMLNGSHGEIPRIVLYPATPEDAFYLAAEAFNLADCYQCPVIIALDLGSSMNKFTIDGFSPEKVSIDRGKLLTEEEAKAFDEHAFKRYRLTDDGVSPRSIPGQKGGVHTANSNEHKEDGFITEDPDIRVNMMNKRMNKINNARVDEPMLLNNTNSETILVGMGSNYGVLTEVVKELKHQGYDVGHVHIQQLHPLPIEELNTLFNGKKIISVENNFTSQLLNWLKQHFPIHNQSDSITRYDGNPFKLTELTDQIKEMI